MTYQLNETHKVEIGYLRYADIFLLSRVIETAILHHSGFQQTAEECVCRCSCSAVSSSPSSSTDCNALGPAAAT